MKASQISDILKDRNQQSRVVDNVMNFFRFKEEATKRNDLHVEPSLLY